MSGWADIGSAATGINKGLELNQQYQQTQDLMDKREETDQKRMMDMQPFEADKHPLMQELKAQDPAMADEFTKTIKMMPGGMTRGNAKKALEALASDAAGAELIGTIGIKAKERELQKLAQQGVGLAGPALAEHNALMAKKGAELQTGAEAFSNWQFNQAIEKQPPEIKRYMANIPGTAKEKMDVLKAVIEETIKGKMAAQRMAGMKLVSVRNPDGTTTLEYVPNAVGKEVPLSAAENKRQEDYQKVLLTANNLKENSPEARAALVQAWNNENPSMKILEEPGDKGGWMGRGKTPTLYKPMSKGEGVVAGANKQNNDPVAKPSAGTKSPIGPRPKTRQEAITTLKEANPNASLDEINEFIDAKWKDLY